MATTPPPATPQAPPPSGGGTNKILLGCGIGCAALIVLVLIAVGVFWTKVVVPMKAQGERLEVLLTENQASVDAIAALDSTYPSAIDEELDGVELLPSQLDAYVAIRTSLGPQAEAVAQARDASASVFDMGQFASGGMDAIKAGIGMMGKMVGAAADQLAARSGLLAAAAEELESASVGPTELARTLEIVEWRFLQNEDALPAALSASERSDWFTKQAQVDMFSSLLDAAGAQMGGSDRAQMERNLESAQERLDDLKALAAERTTLSPATQRLLESRRAELQNLPSPGLIELSMLTENANPMEAMEAFGGM